MSTHTGSKAERAGDSASLEVVARVGLIAYGVVHVLIGWLALRIAWVRSASQNADSSGALAAVADQPFGKVLLWLVAVGLGALALWQVSETIWGFRGHGRTTRVREQIVSGAKAVVYAALAASAASVSLGSRASSSQSQQHASSGVLGWPSGRAIVIVAGLIIIGVGVAGIVKGVRKSFREEIDTSSMSPTLVLEHFFDVPRQEFHVLAGGAGEVRSAT